MSRAALMKRAIELSHDAGYFTVGSGRHDEACRELAAVIAAINALPSSSLLDDYLTDIRRTFRPQGTAMGNARDYLAMTAMGLAGEAGEVSELIKKHLFHDRRNIRAELIEELGDTLAYLVAHADAWGISLEEIIAANVRKRAERYPSNAAFSEVT